MKSYLIFALVLTVAYVIYYAVIIMQDLYGKKGTGKTDEEVFDLGEADDEQESVEVTESETGFDVGGEQYETEAAPIARPGTQEADTDKGDDDAQARFERMKAKAEERMEETVPYLSDARTADEMCKAIICKGQPDGRPEMVWKPLKDRL